MKFTIEKMKHKFEYTDNKVFVSLDGYAFIDESGHTIIIVYGESRRDDMSKYLSSEGDPLGLKYNIITLS